MLLRVRLASHDVPWTFDAAQRLATWLEGTPWLTDGGVLPVRVSGPRQAESLARVVGAAVRAADDGASDVRVCVSGPASSPRTAVGVLRESLEIDFSGRGDDRRDIEVVADVLASRPFVLIVDATGWTGAEAQRALRGLEAIGSATRKLTSGVALTAIILHHEPLWAGGDELMLDVGRPSASLNDALTSPEPALWAAYVHHRVAWESGGDLDRAMAWDDALADRSARVGDDDGLESALGAFSAAAWASIAPARRASVLAFLRSSPGDPARARLIQELHQHRALWRPDGVTHVAPWVARAILLDAATPLLRSQLRWCLVCAPLRRDLLARCLDLEAAVRARHVRDLGDAPEDARADWEAFRLAEPTSDAPFYPANSPAVPDSPFAFVEFGGFLSALRVGQPRAAMLHRLRILRNYLAHGHYVSWGCVREMVEIDRGIGA